MHNQYILLPGPMLKSPILITDLDIQVGFGIVTVVSENILSDKILNKFIINNDIIVEKFDADKCTKNSDSRLFYNDLLVIIARSPEEIKQEKEQKMQELAYNDEQNRISRTMSQMKGELERLRYFVYGVGVKCKFGYGIPLLDIEFPCNGDEGTDYLSDILSDMSFLKWANQNGCFITDWSYEDCPQSWIVSKDGYCETADHQFIDTTVTEQMTADVNYVYKRFCDDVKEKHKLDMPDLKPSWMLLLYHKYKPKTIVV